MIITLDKDFATYPLKNHQGVILLRYKNKSAYNLVEKFGRFLDSPLKEEFENALCEIFDEYVKVHRR